MNDTQTARLTAFVASWKEIETAWQRADRSRVTSPSPADRVFHRNDIDRAMMLEHDAGVLFSVDASDVRAAGRVIEKLLSE